MVAKKTPKKAKVRRRPTKYTKEIANKICLLLSQGKSLRRICAEDDSMPDESTVRYWALENLHNFFPQYARARAIGLDSMADETLDIADDGTNDWQDRLDRDGQVIGTELNHEHVQRSRLRIDTRKWYLSKLAPKRYDKPEAEPESELEPQEDYRQPLEPDEEIPNAPIL